MNYFNCRKKDVQFYPVLNLFDRNIDISRVRTQLMFVKLFIVAIALFIVFSLGKALYYLVHDQGNSERVVKALSWRIGLSLGLFILLFIAFAFGWITPHPVMV